MFGLAIISVICVNIFVLAVSNSTLATESAKGSEVSEEEKSEINLANIQTPEQKEEDEKLKEQWKSHFNQLLSESGK
jgi:hypothetical protein